MAMQLENSFIAGLKEKLGLETKRTAAVKKEWKRRLESVIGEIDHSRIRRSKFVTDRKLNDPRLAYTIYFVQHNKSTWVIRSGFDPSGDSLAESCYSLYGFIIAGKLPNCEGHSAIAYIGDYDKYNDELKLSKVDMVPFNTLSDLGYRKL